MLGLPLLERPNEEKLRRVQALVVKGLSVREAAVRLRVGKAALYEALRHQTAWE